MACFVCEQGRLFSFIISILALNIIINTTNSEKVIDFIFFIDDI